MEEMLKLLEIITSKMDKSLKLKDKECQSEDKNLMEI